MPVLATPLISGLAGLLASSLLTWLTNEQRVPSWFGFIKLTYVRTIASGVFALTAAAGISLSISDHSHREVSYIAWYGAAGLALAVILATTLIIDRKPAGPESPEPAWPLPVERAEVSQIHEQQLHEWLGLLKKTVSQVAFSDFADFPAGASQLQLALITHFPDLLQPLSEWDQAVARSQAAPETSREQIERAVITSPSIPDGYDRESIATSIARLVVAHSGSYRLVLRAVRDDFRDGATFWSVYIASGLRDEAKVAALPDAHIEQILQTASEHEAALQAIVERVGTSEQLPEIAASRAALEALKQPLMDLLAIKSTVSPILFAADCPFCQAQLQIDTAPTTNPAQAIHAR